MTDPTGLDYLEAAKVMYPGLAVVPGFKVQELNDQALKVVHRAAMLRRQERERVKQVFLDLAAYLDSTVAPMEANDENEAALAREGVAALIRKKAEETR